MNTIQLVPYTEYQKYEAKLPNEISQFLDSLSRWLKNEKKLTINPDQLILKKKKQQDTDYYETFEITTEIPKVDQILREQGVKIIVKD